MFKIFAWQERGYWRGQKLVPVASIPAMKMAIGFHQSFASLQTYNEAGEVLFCPVYADLDGEHPRQAQFDAQYIVHLLGEMTNIIPDIYYSGNKGFHIIVPHKISHAHCHLIAKYFFTYLAADLPSLDKRVYRTQALLRLPGSPASRPGYFKVQITKQELMSLSIDAIADLAKVPRVGRIKECDMSQINDEFLAIIAAGEKNIPVFYDQEFKGVLHDLGMELTPCLAKMIETPPTKGARNQTTYLLGRLFKKCGFTEAETLRTLLTKPHFQDFETENRGISNVLSSLYKSKKLSIIGCKTGADAELMHQFCDPLCWFNDKSKDIRFKTKPK